MTLVTYRNQKISDIRNKLESATMLYNRLPELEEFLLRITPLVENIQIAFNEVAHSITVAIIPSKADVVITVTLDSDRTFAKIRFKNLTYYEEDYLINLPKYLWKYKNSIKIEKLETVEQHILIYTKLNTILKPY